MPSPSRLKPSLDKARFLERNHQPREALAVLAPFLAGLEGMPDAQAAEVCLVASDCHFKLADYAQDLGLCAKALALAGEIGDARLKTACGIHRARALYQQGHFAACLALSQESAQAALALGDLVLAARARMVEARVYSTRGEHEASERAALEGLDFVHRGGDTYVEALLHNGLGLHHFYRALTEVLPEGAEHFTAVEPGAIHADNSHLRESARRFEVASAMASRAGLTQCAEVMDGNALRVRVLMGEGAKTLAAFRRLVRKAQGEGERSEEIYWRYNYGWALRTCGNFTEALHQLDTAFSLAKKVGLVTRVLQLLHYDRSLVLAGLGDFAEALKAYDRYARFFSSWSRRAHRTEAAPRELAKAAPRPPLEPFYLKRADQFLAAKGPQRAGIDDLARHCGVSTRTLQASFKRFRGVSPVAHARNLRLEAARRALESGASVAEAAVGQGFVSVTTFSLEYRRRFGEAPRATRAQARRHGRPHLSENAETSVAD